MRKILLVLIIFALSITNIAAQLNGNGYYRIQNNDTERYVYIVDNKGSVNTSTGSIDMRAISLWKDFEKASSDPATIVEIRNFSGSEYDLYAQNTSTYDITGGYHVKIRDNKDGTYMASGTAYGISLFLADTEKSSSPDGFMGNGTSSDRKWRIIPVNQDDGKYFGVKSEIEFNNSYYTTMYANFPFSTTSTNTKVYTICGVRDNIAIIREEHGDIAAGTPVIFKCISEKPIDNKLDIHYSTAKAITDNCLSGTYYCNSKYNHINRVENNKSTMRVLGIMSNGELGFITADCEYMPANKAYLVVSADTPQEIPIMTEEEYQVYLDNKQNEEPKEEPLPNGIQRIESDNNKSYGIYTILGVKISDNPNDIDNLPKGLYIINGRKYIK